MGRGLIIDASVAHAAGTSGYPTSSGCRTFLESVRDICHRLVLTAAIDEEWGSHQSGFTRVWLRSMYARRKVDHREVHRDDALQGAIAVLKCSERDRDGMLKDAHLIEAALQTRCPVVSLDETTARVPFRRACLAIRRLKQVVWVNPTAGHEQPIGWLRAGAPDEEARQLGFGLAE